MAPCCNWSCLELALSAWVKKGGLGNVNAANYPTVKDIQATVNRSRLNGGCSSSSGGGQWEDFSTFSASSHHKRVERSKSGLPAGGGGEDPHTCGKPQESRAAGHPSLALLHHFTVLTHHTALKVTEARSGSCKRWRLEKNRSGWG